MALAMQSTGLLCGMSSSRLGWPKAKHVIVFRYEPTPKCHAEERSDEEFRIEESHVFARHSSLMLMLRVAGRAID